METMLICIPSYSRLGCMDEILPDDSSLAFVTGDYSVQSYLKSRGFKTIYFIRQNAPYVLIHEPIARVLLLEDKIAETCQLMEILKASVRAPITVITKKANYPAKLYELLGAKHVFYSKQDNVKFLIQ
ncbi:hypothetical protein RFW18_18955 [Metabacillus idriensis]|uniref:hypothetical protein n=1 Tax=Metabacillus idriensis TaxID=324768 RepID=UPI002812CE07|nr:hypothetical protein [Metabacillus idriensis]MDR0139839.1 hypothetical protein [Metabacillus idriensis]